MKNKESRKLVAALALGLAVLYLPHNSSADDTAAVFSELQYELDGRIYNKGVLARNFKQIAFNDYMRMADLQIPQVNTDGTPLFLSYKRLKQEYPWLVDYIYRTEGVPRYMALSKWSQPVKVSVGWPNDLKPFDPYLENGDPVKDISLVAPYQPDAKFVGIVRSEVEKNAPVLSKASGLQISYLDKPDETLSDYGNLRIVFHDLANIKDHTLKRGIYATYTTTNAYYEAKPFRAFMEPTFSNIFYFTPSLKHQTEGYFLTNDKNEIDLAVCYIAIKEDENIIPSLIKECLIRSLGLPDAVKGVSVTRSVLSPWREPKPDQDRVRDNKDTSVEYSEFDLFMLNTLYSPDLKAGMSTIDTEKKLFGLEINKQGE